MNRLIMWFLATGLGARIQLQVLMNLATSSLSLSARNVLTMPHDKALLLFATITSQHLPTSLPSQRRRLHQNSARLGHRLRNLLTDKSDTAITALVFRLYQNIGIEMEGLLPAQINVNRCFFSNHYSAETCTIASLMDSGIISALYGKGELCFTKRITEGNGICCCHIKI